MPNWKKLIVSGSSAHLYNLNVASAVTASYFVGDGSGLTNVNSTISEQATVSDTFTSTLTKVVNHNFSSKNLVISVYDEDDNQIIPANVNLTDLDNVTITFDQLSTGTVVVAKGGHIVGGNARIDQVTTVTDTFTNAISKVVTHDFNTRNVLVSVYDNQYNQIIPETVNVANLNSVSVTFTQQSSGFVVVGRAGHIVSGSQLVDIAEVVTQADSFTSQTTYTATHNFGTKNVFVTVYDNDDNVIIPAIINTPTSSSVQLTFAEPTTGRVVIGKAGHIIAPESVNLTLFPYTGNASITGSLGITGQSEFGGNLVPKTPQGATLGTAERPFREIYLQSGSINIESDTPGDPSTRLSNVDGNILVSAGGMQLTGAASFRAATGSFDYISGSMTQIGDYTQFGDYKLDGDKEISGSLKVSGSISLNGNKLYNFGQFYDTTTQSGSANTAHSMKVNTTDISSGVSVVDGTKIKVDNKGIYNVQFSTQLEQTTNGASDISIWLRKDGVNVTNSNTEITIEKVAGGGKLVAAWNYMIQLNANQYVELVWSSNSANTQLHYHSTQTTPTRPATPSVIITVTQIA